MTYKIFIHFFRTGMKPGFRLLSASFLLMAVPGVAAPENALSARKQIYAAVQLKVSDIIHQEAKNHPWPEYQAKMNLFIPSESAQLPVCGKALSVSLPERGHFALSRLRVNVRCDEGQGWEIAVTVKPDIYLPVIVARHALERGQTLTSADISLKKLNVSNAHGGYVLRPQEVLGLTVKRRIHELQPIAMTQLDAPVLVERGQSVAMIAIQDGVEAQTVGEAMKKGRKGEMIKVKNESSERVVNAIVTDTGVVHTISISDQ